MKSDFWSSALRRGHRGAGSRNDTGLFLTGQCCSIRALHHQKSLVFPGQLVEGPIPFYGRPGQRVHDQLLGPRLGDAEGAAVGHDHHGLRVPVGEVDVVDELDAAGVADHVPAYRDP